MQARGEQLYAFIFCFAFAGNQWEEGCRWIQLAVYFYAGLGSQLAHLLAFVRQGLGFLTQLAL